MTALTIHRTGVVHPTRGPKRMTFVYLMPQSNRVQLVIDAATIDDAWMIATGWDDEAGIAQCKAAGWRVLPCMVEWQE